MNKNTFYDNREPRKDTHRNIRNNFNTYYNASQGVPCHTLKLQYGRFLPPYPVHASISYNSRSRDF